VDTGQKVPGSGGISTANPDGIDRQGFTADDANQPGWFWGEPQRHAATGRAGLGMAGNVNAGCGRQRRWPGRGEVWSDGGLNQRRSFGCLHVTPKLSQAALAQGPCAQSMAKPDRFFVKGWAFVQLKQQLGDEGFLFLSNAFGVVETLLPHLQTELWATLKTPENTRVNWIGNDRLEMKLTLQLNLGQHKFRLTTKARRRRADVGAGAIAKTLDLRELDICRQILERIAAVLKTPVGEHGQHSLRAIRGLFVEQVVGAHLQKHLQIKFDVGQLFSALRELAEQSYENKSITYGLVIRGDEGGVATGKQFPLHFFEKKRYRALSDGYRTAFEINRSGKLLRFRDLQAGGDKGTGNHYFPEWCRYLAGASAGNCCGIALTRQGDILVFDGGSLRFSYRAGRWQYWNHTHAINIFRNRMRVQHVLEDIVSAVVNRIYRVTLDVSFRRSGCLFVMLKNQQNMRKLVADGDAIGDPQRDELYGEFDTTLNNPNVRTLTTTLLVELSALDGGVVVNNHGKILAYGAVLKTRGRSGASEGSRTKAALSASEFGVAVKVSSDGDMEFFESGKAFLKL